MMAAVYVHVLAWISMRTPVSGCCGRGLRGQLGGRGNVADNCKETVESSEKETREEIQGIANVSILERSCSV
ncbi:hypothetical protein F4604DRAFT_129159 [Suillus subluteus]|nr:hypothetical protein F4604DRAFT_129159 [Suillus subluteus]